MENKQKEPKKDISRGQAIFYITLLYYVFWICAAIYCYFFGSSWEFISSLGNHQTKYGMDAVENIYFQFILYTVLIFPFVPIYQVVYIIYRVIKKIIKK